MCRLVQAVKYSAISDVAFRGEGGEQKKSLACSLCIRALIAFLALVDYVETF